RSSTTEMWRASKSSARCARRVLYPRFSHGARAARRGVSPAESGRLRLPRRALALVFLEQALAQPDALRGDLDQLVVGDELHRPLQGELDGRGQQDVVVLARGAHVGELLLP